MWNCCVVVSLRYLDALAADLDASATVKLETARAGDAEAAATYALAV